MNFISRGGYSDTASAAAESVNSCCNNSDPYCVLTRKYPDFMTKNQDVMACFATVIRVKVTGKRYTFCPVYWKAIVVK